MTDSVGGGGNGGRDGEAVGKGKVDGESIKRYCRFWVSVDENGLSAKEMPIPVKPV
jgi:hypothetical protein